MISLSGQGSVVSQRHWYAFHQISISLLSPHLCLAVSHNRHFQLWEEGTPASAGVQTFAELGLTVELMKAAKDARKRRGVGAMYRTAGIPNGIGHSSTELLMQTRNSLVGANKTLMRSYHRHSAHMHTHMLRHTKSYKPVSHRLTGPSRGAVHCIWLNFSVNCLLKPELHLAERHVRTASWNLPEKFRTLKPLSMITFDHIVAC